MQKVTFNPETRISLKKGLDTVADAVKVTIGPRGRNVLVKNSIGSADVTNDGGKISESIFLIDPLENAGAEIVKSVISKTSDEVGGGRTASAILTQAIVHEGFKLSDKGISMLNLKKGMDAAVFDICTNLDISSRDVTTKQQIKQVASISTESDELGEMIAKVLFNVGTDGVVTVEESQVVGIFPEVTEGLEINKGFVSPYMMTDFEKQEAIYKDVEVLVTTKSLAEFKELLPLVAQQNHEGEWMPTKKNLVVICEDITEDTLDTIVRNRLKGVFSFLVIKAPGYGEYKKNWLEDIAVTVGATVVDEHSEFTEAHLGKAKKVTSTKESTVVIGSGTLKVKSYVESLRLQPGDNKKRIARLLGGVVVIKVGANSEQETGYLKKKIEDGVNESKRALEEGIVVGGDIAFINAAKTLNVLKTGSEFAMGYNLILKAVEEPFKQIIHNGGEESQVILNQIKSSTSDTIGYDALENKIVKDMFKVGIVDALKVSRTVLNNAVSAAYMFLTIEVASVYQPETHLSTE